MSTSATLATPAAAAATAGVAETVAGAVSGLVQSARGEEQKRKTSLVTKHRPADETKPQKEQEVEKKI